MSKHWIYKVIKHGGEERVSRFPSNLESEPITFYRKEKAIMRKFWELLKESVIGRLVLATMFSSATIYLLVTQQTVPTELWAVNSLILGSFFGSRSQQIRKG